MMLKYLLHKLATCLNRVSQRTSFSPLNKIEVQSPPGTTIGYVVQNWHMFLPKLSVLGPSKENLLQIEGPCCAISCCGDVDFEVRRGNFKNNTTNYTN